ncbi:serine/threonine-protein kinase SBK2-like [Gadus morhua]|uniref:serine/threonine-protein kinase SBK2-like n=1 Tax=Gadus morhua TaxID=8049 RepID=UPI0011B81E5F|nr:serine/threonine-protein kinase SBK2-like [Gadus morhua]
MTAATKLLDELCHLSVQSMTSLETEDHFRVVKLLGEGSYGKVMLVVHKKTGSPMALKYFLRASTSLFSFLREYNLSLAFCAHPSLTRALGIAYRTPTHYVFAQQVGLHGDLYDLIVPEGGVEEGSVQRVVSQLSGALAHLHAHGLVHRDLKPENVFLCDPAGSWVKLGDFGMVKAVGSRIQEVWYSSAYCPPEAQGARRGGAGAPLWVAADPSVDCWALGILTYALLTGALPWAETACCNPSYRRYRDWVCHHRCCCCRCCCCCCSSPSASSSPSSPSPSSSSSCSFSSSSSSTSSSCSSCSSSDAWGSELSQGPGPPVAPQFRGFTPLACSLFRALLDPRPRLRGRPGDALAFLGEEWLRGEERSRLEAERKRRRSGGEGLRTLSHQTSHNDSEVLA